MQAGILYPLMRGHSAMGTQPHEPWMFGPEVEAISREYIELRYRLLPTLYTLFQEAAATGAPILRPLLYHYPDDPATAHLYDQVLLGPNLLAAPVVRPGVRERLVYLPEGVWYDWWTGAQHAGPARIIAPAPLDRLPLYVRAGAIVPLGPVMQHTGERPLDELTVRVWPGEGAFTLYEDDGHSFAYRQGAWATTAFSVHTTGGETVVAIGPRAGSYTPPAREVIVAVEGVDSQRFADDGSARRLVF
jgi:alpha-glucosidase